MSCGNFNDGHVSGRSGECISDVVRKIIKAQHRAVRAEEDTCLTSCDQSIDDLLSDFERNRRRLRHNTIPFILFCKESCKPFVGSGVIQDRRGRSDRHFFKCIESPIFRAKNFVNGDENCVRLELLKPVRDHHHVPRDASDVESKGGGSHHHKHSCGCHSVCDFFDRHVEDFQATGVCITVDLRCFCAITCLDPITPLRARRRDEECD